MTMEYASHIIFSKGGMKGDVKSYEISLAARSLGEKLTDCQQFCKNDDEFSISKVLLLFLQGGDEIRHETKRIFAWTHRREKANFLILQLESKNKNVRMAAIDLLGVLEDPIAISHLGSIFNLHNAEISIRIVGALSQIGSPLGLETILKALFSSDKSLLTYSIEKLSRRTDVIPWRVFKKLLSHPDRDVRANAAFAISLRKVPKSAACLLNTLQREKDKKTRRELIQYLGNIPSEKILIHLLRIALQDADQKSRLSASRSLDRLQGILPPKAIFKLRHNADAAVRAEAIFRIGKFGCEIAKYKKFILKTLSSSKDTIVLQSCLLALGHIAERKDADVLIAYLKKDPLLAYCAAMSLTKILRLEDSEGLFKILRENPPSLIKQIILQHMCRRRLFADPDKLLETIKITLNGDTNINTRYLAFRVLEYVPTEDVLEFLISEAIHTGNIYEGEAIGHSLESIMSKHGEVLLPLLHRCNVETCFVVLKHLPQNMDAPFYKKIASTFFELHGSDAGDEVAMTILQQIVERIIHVPKAVTELLNAAPDAVWKTLILQFLIEHADRDAIAGIKDELVEMIRESDYNVRVFAMLLLISLKDENIIPLVVEIAESDKRDDVRMAARNIAKELFREAST